METKLYQNIGAVSQVAAQVVTIDLGDDNGLEIIQLLVDITDRFCN